MWSHPSSCYHLHCASLISITARTLGQDEQISLEKTHCQEPVLLLQMWTHQGRDLELAQNAAFLSPSPHFIPPCTHTEESPCEEDTVSASILVLDVQSPELWEDKFLRFKPTQTIVFVIGLSSCRSWLDRRTPKMCSALGAMGHSFSKR